MIHTLVTSSINPAVLGPTNVACDAERQKICKLSAYNFACCYGENPPTAYTVTATKTMSFYKKLGAVRLKSVRLQS